MSKQKILIIEDDILFGEIMLRKIKDAGFDAELVVDGGLGLQKIVEFIPDLILLDIWLLGEDGGQIAKLLKQKKETKHIPIIIMSANNETEKITNDAGANDFLLKPFNIDDLLYVVKKHI